MWLDDVADSLTSPGTPFKPYLFIRHLDFHPGDCRRKYVMGDLRNHRHVISVLLLCRVIVTCGPCIYINECLVVYHFISICHSYTWVFLQQPLAEMFSSDHLNMWSQRSRYVIQSRRVLGDWRCLSGTAQDKDRVNIAKNNITDDPSGGFLMEFHHGEKDLDGTHVMGNM